MSAHGKAPMGKPSSPHSTPALTACRIDSDLSNDPKWIERIKKDIADCGVNVDYRYYGTGDRGGAPGEKSIQNMEKSVTGNGPIKVISCNSDQIFSRSHRRTKSQAAKIQRRIAADLAFLRVRNQPGIHEAMQSQK